MSIAPISQSMVTDEEHYAQLARAFFSAATKESTDDEDILPQEDGDDAKLSVFHLFCELFPEVAALNGKNKRLRLHFNKIGYQMYGKEQSRRVPAVRAKPGNPGYGFRHARWRDPVSDPSDRLACEKVEFIVLFPNAILVVEINQQHYASSQCPSLQYLLPEHLLSAFLVEKLPVHLDRRFVRWDVTNHESIVLRSVYKNFVAFGTLSEGPRDQLDLDGIFRSEPVQLRTYVPCFFAVYFFC